MTIALFIESNPRIPGFTRQHLILPAVRDGEQPAVWGRVTDGTKGRGNKWADLGSIDNAKALSFSDEKVSKVVAVGVTATNARDLLDSGWSASVATRLVSAPNKGAGKQTLHPVLDALYTALVNGNDSLLDLVDGTKPTHVSPYLITNPTPAAPVLEIVQPTAQEEPVLVTRMAQVPDIAVADRYIHRKVHGVDDFKVFDSARARGENVLLYGPTGPGKTTAAKAYAAANSLPVAMVSGTVALEPSQLFGKFVPDGKGGFTWADGVVTEVVRHGGVLILDEVNFIPAKIATVLFALLDSTRSITLLDHKGEVIKAHQDLLIVATMNPGYAGTQDLNKAFRNRFKHQIPWGYDDSVEKKLVSSKALREVAKKLREAEAKGQVNTPTPTNALIDFVDLVSQFGLEYAISNFVARFEDDEEQNAVRLVIDAQRSAIEKDLGLVEAEPDAEIEEEIEEEVIQKTSQELLMELIEKAQAAAQVA